MVNIRRTRTFFHQKLSFPQIRTKHTVAHKPMAVANEDPYLAQPLGQRHATGNHLGAGGFSPDDLKQPHQIRRAKEMSSDDLLGTRRHGGNFIDVERGGVRSQDRAAVGEFVQLREDLLLQRKVFKHRLDDDVGLREAGVAEGRLDHPHALGHKISREAAVLNRPLVVGANRLEASIKSLLRDFP